MAMRACCRSAEIQQEFQNCGPALRDHSFKALERSRVQTPEEMFLIEKQSQDCGQKDSCLHHCASSPTLILSLPPGALQVMNLEVQPQSLWCATFLNKLSLPEIQTVGLTVHSQTLYDFVIGAKHYMIHPLACCDILAFFWGEGGLSFPHDALSFQSNPVFHQRNHFCLVQSVCVAVKNLSGILLPFENWSMQNNLHAASIFFLCTSV